MAFISTTFSSQQLQMQTEAKVIIPLGHKKESKILYLLHGLSDNCSTWSLRTRIYEYAEQHNYIVIMPEVQRSFYCDMKYGGNYFTYVAYELPQICEKLFGLRHERESTFVAGLSMGGYGAIKCGLTRPDFYAGIASFSGAVDISGISGKDEDDKYYMKEVYAICGEDTCLKDTDNLFYLSKQVNKLPEGQRPRIFQTCGSDDFLLDGNRKFNAAMDKLQFDYKYIEWSGTHNWDFWDQSIQLTLDYFDEK